MTATKEVDFTNSIKQSIAEFNLVIIKKTHITGKTFGKTTEASARYSYKILVSFSSVEYLTSVAKTVKTRVCVEKSVSTSGSRSTLFSLLTLTRALRFCNNINNY